jgi:predicted component of type VI protein secretion system
MPIQIPALRRSPAHSGSAPASLMRVSENGHTLPGSAVPLDTPEITIGSSSKKAAYVLASTSVDGLHARLRQPAEGQYRIFDAGSVAGTWVNYSLVPDEGTCLQHGDLVQMGREAFRFELKNPNPPRKPMVSDEAVDLPARTAGEQAP